MARTLLDGSSGWLDGSSGGASVFDSSILTWIHGSRWTEPQYSAVSRVGLQQTSHKCWRFQIIY